MATQDVSFTEMAKRQQALSAVIMQNPAVESVSSTIGIDGNNTSLNSGRLQIKLKPFGQRDDKAVQSSNSCSRRQRAWSAFSSICNQAQDLTVNDQVTPSQYQFTLDDANSEDLVTWSPKLVAALQKRPEFYGVVSNLQDQGQVAYVELNRDKAARLGVTAADVDTALYSAFGQRLVSTIFTQSNQYRVVLEVAPQYQQARRFRRCVSETLCSTSSTASDSTSASSSPDTSSASTATARPQPAAAWSG